eukprot:TRINITY_DN4062_c0_g2_i1.p1 TRINITY_DN4062_c0_g2~~TRINITY_DN4062_c0_g2_i1.p1  ORF type:complete len:129 (+),score=29.71 TRINITY_DN4062_c0_g2_i1:36-422(+)
MLRYRPWLEESWASTKTELERYKTQHQENTQVTKRRELFKDVYKKLSNKDGRFEMYISDKFFHEDGPIMLIVEAILDSSSTFDVGEPKILSSSSVGNVELTKKQVFTLLSHAFFSLFPNYGFQNILKR